MRELDPHERAQVIEILPDLARVHDGRPLRGSGLRHANGGDELEVGEEYCRAKYHGHDSPTSVRYIHPEAHSVPESHATCE